ncbi:glycosyltransferase [Sulfurimonas sp. SWIR-19]|uniref:glycosyltransferase n=1 Tax=Sulfurimonas sp. SWIR-19 TaxID=2878390 RepID=UPI001CF55024|nr:glycosyltransferase [Sulfurimonas sp. SWIR-19]UCN01129.1 glycosyltransferase [Sulfurimonas sp. SWIR-19]
MKIKNKDVALIILNYKTPKDTVALVKNIEEQLWSKKIKIYIVDNGSDDDSIEIFNNFECGSDIELIESKINLGFAGGNNLGIQKALLDGFQFIIASNSDIVIEKQSNFIKKIYEIYSQDQDVAIIAPLIKNLDGVYQNPFRKERFSFKEIIKMKFFYLTGFYKMYYFLRVYVFFDLITYIAHKKNAQRIKHNYGNNAPPSGYIYAPHGSFLVFTPTFFKYFNGFDNKTFLYCEEFILAEKLRQNDLKCWYENTLNVLHKECQSTEKIVKNYKAKVKFTLKYTFSSCRYFASLIGRK